MNNNEDKILKEAVQIAVSQPELCHTDMVDIIQESTGVSFSIAQQAVEQATETIQQQTEEPNQSRKDKVISIAIIVGFLWIVGALGLLFFPEGRSKVMGWNLLCGISLSALVLIVASPDE